MISGISFDNVLKKWWRACPKCEKILYYKNKYYCNATNKINGICKSCAFTKIVDIPSTITYDNEKKVWYKECPKCYSKVKQQSKSFAILNINSVCKRCRKYGVPNHTIETKSKISKKAIIRWKRTSFRDKMNKSMHYVRFKNINNNIVASYNPKVCDFINNINKKNSNIFFRHQQNHPHGEFSYLCYFADGYDEKNNIWFEYDEPHH